jgi:ribosomal protein S6E (S10)
MPDGEAARKRGQRTRVPTKGQVIMRAVDTNIVVGYVMNDDVAQAARARRLVDETSIFVPARVVLETA